MSSTTSRSSANDSTSSSTFRVNYSEYVADITGSPRTVRKLPTGAGNYNNPIHNPYPNRPTQPAQQPAGPMPQYGGGAEKCARCAKSVYLAERKVGAGRAFHTSCFNCKTCKRKLEATNLTEHKGEIYCKPCYTKQFGAHGLVSGVTMSTAHTSTREIQYTRRASFGSDLDTTPSAFQQIRQRTHSSENVFRDDHDSRTNDRFAQQHTRPIDASRDRASPISERKGSVSNLVDATYRPSAVSERKGSVSNLVDSTYRRSPSPSTNVQIPVQTSTNSSYQRSSYSEENDRKKYAFDGEKISYGNGASALVEIPVTVHTKRSDSTIDRSNVPVNPPRSRSPSVTSNESSQRQSNVSDDFPRYNPIDDRSTHRPSVDNTVKIIGSNSNDPSSTHTYYHSSSSSSYQAQYRSTAANSSNAIGFDREGFRSRDSSPVAITNRNRSPSPVSQYTSSSTTTQSHRTTDTPRGSTAGYTPVHDYLNTQTSSSVIGHRSPSPSSHSSSSTRPTSTLNEFVSKTNVAGNATSAVGQFSALGALIPNARRRFDDDDDDGFGN